MSETWSFTHTDDLVDDILRVVHAFGDDGRRNGIRQLAGRVAGVLSERDAIKSANATLSESLRVAREEGERLRVDSRSAANDWNRLSDRVTTVADEAFGPFPVQSAEDALTAIEAGVFDFRKRLDEATARGLALAAESNIAERERDDARVRLAEARELVGDLRRVARLCKPDDWRSSVIAARDAGKAEGLNAAADSLSARLAPVPVPTRTPAPVPGPPDAPCTCSWAGVGRETCRSPHHVETDGKPAPGHAPAKPREDAVAEDTEFLEAIADDEEGRGNVANAENLRRIADDMRAPEPRQAGTQGLVDALEAIDTPGPWADGAQARIARNALAAYRGEPRQAGEVTREAPRAPFFPACCDLSRCGHREGCPGKAAEAPPLVAAPEVATLAHGQSKRPVAPPTPGPASAPAEDVMGDFGRWIQQVGATMPGGKAPPTPGPTILVDGELAKALYADVDSGCPVCGREGSHKHSVVINPAADVSAKACESWCGADLMTPPAPSVLAWSNDDGWWCSVACKRAGRPLRPSTATKAAAVAKCACCCIRPADYESTGRRVTWQKVCQVCLDDAYPPGSVSRGDYFPPDGRRLGAPKDAAPAASGGAPVIYARAVNAGAVDAPAVPAADVACERCNGSGGYSDEFPVADCPKCDGTGKRPSTATKGADACAIGNPAAWPVDVCLTCEGDGCNYCGGTGKPARATPRGGK